MSTHNIPFSLNFPNLQPNDFFLGTQERVCNSLGKRAISVRAIEVLLYYDVAHLEFASCELLQ